MINGAEHFILRLSHGNAADGVPVKIHGGQFFRALLS